MQTDNEKLANSENTKSKTAATPGTKATEKKYPPNRIGLQKKAIIAILAVATMLIPIQTQAAVNWLVEIIRAWAAGKALDAATEAVLNANGGVTLTGASPTSKANVNGSNWLSNEWTLEHRIQPTVDGPWETKTATASMGHQQDHTTAKGTRKDGTAMTQAEAVRKMNHGKYSVRWVRFETFDGDGFYFKDFYASARTDWINGAVNRKFRKLRQFYRTNTTLGIELTLGPIWELETTTRNVGSYEVVSRFRNPSGNIALSNPEAEDSEADKYIGTLYWVPYYVHPSGNIYRRRERREPIEFTTVKETDTQSYDVVKNNQRLFNEPKINAGANRFFEDEDVREEKNISAGPGAPPVKVWELVGYRRVCNQTESDQYKLQD